MAEHKVRRLPVNSEERLSGDEEVTDLLHQAGTREQAKGFGRKHKDQ